MTKKITPKQKDFVKNYTSEDKKTRLNGVKSALKSYDTEDYNTANQIAVDNLQKPTITKEIDKALDDAKLTDKMVYPELKKVIKQDKHLSSKLGGIQTYSRLRRHDQTEEESKSMRVAFIISTGDSYGDKASDILPPPYTVEHEDISSNKQQHDTVKVSSTPKKKTT